MRCWPGSSSLRPRRRPLLPVTRCLIASAVALATAVRPGAAQDIAGPFIPLGSRLDRLVIWAADGGALPSIDPSSRPFRLGQVRRSVVVADTAEASASARRALEWLREALGGGGDNTTLVAEIAAQAYTNAGITETVRIALRTFVSTRAQQELMKLRGTVTFSMSAAELTDKA